MVSKEIAKQEAQVPALIVDEEDEAILTSMIRLPSLYLCQKMTKVVEAEKAKVGDLFENLQNTVVCPKDKTFSFVPLKIKNVITTYRVLGNKKQFVKRAPRTKDNEQKEWDEVADEIINGQKVKSTFKHLPETQVYLINSEDLEKGNLVLPMVFTFRGASMPKGGKSIYTQAMLLKSSGLNLFSHRFKMTNEKETKGDNTFQVAMVERSNEKVPAEQQIICAKWLETINSMRNVEILEEEDVEEVNAEVKPARAPVARDEF